ncbi:MAG: hypothetical protein AB7T31_15945 [Gemmatimonadales bacterium]
MTRAPMLPAGVLVLVVLAAHLSLYPKIADLDAFYHIGHAAAYAERSIFDTSFPWATQSVVADHGADLWWGFHVALLPLAIGGVEWGIRVGALALTVLVAATFFHVARRHGAPQATWWTVAFLVAVPNVLFREIMLRPHVASLAGALLLLSVLVRGRWWQAMALGAAIAWLHLGLAWVGPAVAVAYAFVRAVEHALGSPEDHEGVPPLSALAAVTFGACVGWVLRPHPVETLELASVQIIRLLAVKATEEPLTFSAELAPLSLRELVGMAWLFLVVWGGAVVAAAYGAASGRLSSRPEGRRVVFTALLISTAFLGLALLSARRAMEYWVAFGCLALPFVAPMVTPWLRQRGLRAVLALVLTVHVGWAAWRHHLNVELVASPPDTMAGVASFLTERSAPGDIVFHAKWDNFGPLFARDRSNLYLGGMDPIFQFSHDPARYWEFFYLSADLNTEWTCDAFPCASGVATDTHVVLRDHFGARWVVVEPWRSPRFTLYLLNDPRYRLAHETQREAVFEVLPEGPPA